jgi:phosphatidylserine/phosphatidylglycerophosphate/cardiolipin synthase-like enzyme
MRSRRVWLRVVLLLLAAIVMALATLYAEQAQARPTVRTLAGPWYRLHFTIPSYPDRPESHHGGIDESLVAFVDGAQRSIDAAVYDFDLPNVADALVRARNRGVEVRFVTDTDTWTSTNADVRAAWRILARAAIPVADDRRGAIMHHKFMVVDRQRVWTGSWNWTTGDTYRLDNHAIEIASAELAGSYGAEFERMFGQRQFGAAKRGGSTAQQLALGGASVESYFAPKDSITPRIVERLGAAASSISFLAFSFTEDKIGDAMIARHVAGVPVRGVFETTGSQTRFSELARLRAAGLDVMADGNPYAMHHKMIVVDGRTSIFGSFNFSANAAEDNDENILFVEDPGLAQALLGEVDRVVARARQRQ